MQHYMHTAGPVASAASVEGAMEPTARPSAEAANDSSVRMPRNLANLQTSWLVRCCCDSGKDAWIPRCHCDCKSSTNGLPACLKGRGLRPVRGYTTVPNSSGKTAPTGSSAHSFETKYGSTSYACTCRDSRQYRKELNCHQDVCSAGV